MKKCQSVFSQTVKYGCGWLHSCKRTMLDRVPTIREDTLRKNIICGNRSAFGFLLYILPYAPLTQKNLFLVTYILLRLNQRFFKITCYFQSIGIYFFIRCLYLNKLFIIFLISYFYIFSKFLTYYAFLLCFFYYSIFSMSSTGYFRIWDKLQRIINLKRINFC